MTLTLRPRTLAGRRRRQVTLVYGVSLVGCAAVLVPVLWMVSTALKADNAVFSVPPQIVPRNPTLANVPTATRLIPFWRYAGNSLLIAGLGSIGTVLSSSFVAYPLARLRTGGLKVVFALVLATMLLPQQVLLITQFLIFKRLGWYGTYLPLIVPSFLGGGAFNIFLLRQFFLSLPPELDQAALVDGASYWRIYWRIILPQSVPALLAVGILDFVSKWNDFLGPLIYLNRTSSYTLPLGLASFRDVYDTAWNYLMVDTLLAVVPCLVLFFVAQRLLVRGLVVRGTKG
ncbi:MAG: carbohydrate ABC transporter permease [Acidimicrobiales bacterium]